MSCLAERSTIIDHGTIALSVIAPCFNEAQNIDILAARTLKAFDELGLVAELILIDDGSSDATWACIEACNAGDPRVRGVRHATNRGMLQGWLSGLDAARGELVCIIDADLQNRPEDIGPLYHAYIVGGTDFVQAVRHAVPGNRHRSLFSKGLNHLLNLLFGTSSRDSKSGFFLCRRESALAILTHRWQYRYFQCFVGVSAHLHGCRIREVDTVFEARHAGESFLGRFPLLISLRALWEVFKFRSESWLCADAEPIKCGTGVSPMQRRRDAGATRNSVCVRD